MNGSDVPVTPQRHIADLIKEGKNTEVGNALAQEFQSMKPGAFNDFLHKVLGENNSDRLDNSSLPGIKIEEDGLGNTEVGITTPGKRLGNAWRDETPVFADVAITKPDEPYRAKHDETVVAEGNAQVMAFGRSQVIARDHSNAYMFDHSQYTAEQGSAVYADNFAHGTAEKGAEVQAYGNSQFTAKSGSFVDARGDSQGTAESGSYVDATGHSKYKAEAGSKVMAGEHSEGTAEAGSQILADGNALVVGKAGSTIETGSIGANGVRVIGEPGSEVKPLTEQLNHHGTGLELSSDLLTFNAPHPQWHWGPTFNLPAYYPPAFGKAPVDLSDWQQER